MNRAWHVLLLALIFFIFFDFFIFDIGCVCFCDSLID